MTGAAAEPFVARYSIPKLLGWSFAALAMAAACVAVVLGAFGAPGSAQMLAGAVGTVFFGGIGAVHARRLFDRRTQVEIDSRGVFVRSHGGKRIGLRSITGMHADMGRLSLTLHTPAKYPIETAHRRFIYRINGSAARGFFGDVWIWSNMLDQPTAAFTEAIRAHRPKTDFEKRIAETVAGWEQNGGPYGQPAQD
jgi:hypothetical protein